MRALQAARALKAWSRGPLADALAGDGARALSTSGLKDVLAEKIPAQQVRDRYSLIKEGKVYMQRVQ